ncbi:MAG: right-handed parallel beta-helix repeat-containing protein [Asticcacaulis sp.]|nr:right-handed parallel beta-helix repeat-containing protein [Asticcacaulis sp.]
MMPYNGRIDRRGVLGFAAAGGVAALSRRAWAGAKVAADALLPDGTAFTLWEQPLSFSRTYYVDNTSAAADDNGPGDQARPFRTINRAAQVLQPGERVVIAAGTYRECVRPARGGDGPSRMISYEAAPGARVCIKGSEILADGWHQETVTPGFRPPGSATPAEGGVTTWRHALDGALFPDAYNPFALPSIMGQWNWLDPTKVDMGPYLRRRGLVFVDGMPLEPVEQLRELAAKALPPVPNFTAPAVPQNGLPARRRGGPVMQEIGGMPDARVWVDPSGTAIQIRLTSGTPADHVIEVTTRQHAFIPARSGLSYIRVKGLTFQHAGNAYPFPQYGMVSLAGGDHWVLEDNTLEWANGIGLAIGFDGDSAGARNAGASQVIRRNTLRYCGVEGIGGMGTTDALIEDNLIEWCGWADAERGWEAAGAKFHRARNMMFRRNVVRHMRHANAVWWDSENANCRITGNIFADVLTVSAAVHLEMNREANQIDNNIIWDVRNAEPGTPGQRGCAGSGLFINATDKVVVAQNLIGRCDNSGIFAIVRPDRAGAGNARDNTISNNIFASCGTSAIVFLDRKNTADGNVYVDMPARFLGFYEGDTKTYFDLASWRAGFGWDRTSVAPAMQVGFDPATLRLTLSGAKALLGVAAVNAIQSDLLGTPTKAVRVAGPLANLSSRDAWMVDPRRKAGI